MKKTILTIILTAVICFAVVGTTFAFLVDKTEPIKNTFTVGNVDITLTETDPTPDDTTDENKYKMVPGADIAKDPTVTVKANSEACWLFVKVEKSNNIDTYLNVVMDSGWTLLDGTTDVYYQSVASATTDQSFAVLKDNKVFVKADVTKAMLDSIKTQGPTLTFTAYAVQQDGITTAADAWSVATTGNLPADTTVAP